MKKEILLSESMNELSALFDRLFPLCRSILGDGYRKSLEILKEYIPFQECVYQSGEKVLNWTVPDEWVIREAWIKDADGNKIIDFDENNLHVINYSESIDCRMDLQELSEHIYVSEVEDAIPYVTSYYKKRYGFCMTNRQKKMLKPGNYHAYIDSEFKKGRLIVGEVILPGKSSKEILISSYLCHPSMANNELSGPLVQAMLYQMIKQWPDRKYSYRFVINPETIGSIAYLSNHGKALKEKVHAGMVLTCLGGSCPLRIKESKRANSPFVYYAKKREIETVPFTPASGSDERQYCSPGFDLPIVQVARMVYGTYPEYHTSKDNKELMGLKNIIDSAKQLENFLLEHEKENYYVNKFPYGEVKLGDYDLYPSVNADGNRLYQADALIGSPGFVEQVMVLLNYCDGNYSLSHIGQLFGFEEKRLKAIAELLVQKGLLEEI